MRALFLSALGLSLIGCGAGSPDAAPSGHAGASSTGAGKGGSAAGKGGGSAMGGGATGGAAATLEPDLSCAALPDPHCKNALSAAVLPTLRKAGLPIRDADPAELCRRMAIDLIGRIPTDKERTVCATQSPEQMADTFFAMPEYETVQRRTWAELLGFDFSKVYWPYLIELDDLAGQLARDELAYPDFAAHVIMHPGFYQRFPGDGWAQKLFPLFLGRTARQDEQIGLRPLIRIWARAAG